MQNLREKVLCHTRACTRARACTLCTPYFSTVVHALLFNHYDAWCSAAARKYAAVCKNSVFVMLCVNRERIIFITYRIKQWTIRDDIAQRKHNGTCLPNVRDLFAKRHMFAQRQRLVCTTMKKMRVDTYTPCSRTWSWTTRHVICCTLQLAMLHPLFCLCVFIVRESEVWASWQACLFFGCVNKKSDVHAFLWVEIVHDVH